MLIRSNCGNINLTASDNVWTEEHNRRNCITEPAANERIEIPSINVEDDI